MMPLKLTNCACAAHKGLMGKPVKFLGQRTAIVMAMIGSAALSGCITVNAPEEAIVIELNINITQEVIYRLAEDAGQTIDENADIF